MKKPSPDTIRAEMADFTQKSGVGKVGAARWVKSGGGVNKGGPWDALSHYPVDYLSDYPAKHQDRAFKGETRSK